MKDLAVTYNELGRHKEALCICNQQLPLLEQHFGREYPEITECLDSLATAHMMLGHVDEALQISTQGLEIADKADDEIMVELLQEYLRILDMTPEEIEAMESTEDGEPEDIDDGSAPAQIGKHHSIGGLSRLFKALKLRKRPARD